MELTRRDAVAALATRGAGVGSGCLNRTLGERRQGPETLTLLTAAAEVVYPNSVTGHEGFVLGRIEERVRYFVVNELLYAFYASAKGDRLAGIENPVGHLGGIASYQRGSMPEGDDD